MCQYKTEGGRRCPVHRHDSMAAIGLAVRESGLTDKQVSDVFIELRREGRGLGRAVVPEDEWNGYLRSLRRDTQISDRVIMENLSKALFGESEAPNRSTFYALKNLRARSAARALALQGELARIARENEQHLQEIQSAYESALEQADTSRDAAVDDSYTASAVEAAQTRNLPSDRGTLTALHTVQASIERAPERRVQLVELDESDSRNFSHVGYDRSSGRLEVVFRHLDQDKILAYRNVPESTWQSFSENYALLEMRRIQNSPHHQYRTSEQEAAAAHAPRCLRCGQFTGAYHACRTPGGTPPLDDGLQNPLDASSRIIPSVPHVSFPHEFTHTPTARTQCYPSQGSYSEATSRRVQLSELGIGNNDGMIMITQNDLAEQLDTETFTNLDPEQVRQIREAPRSTEFILRNANYIDPGCAMENMSIGGSHIPRPSEVHSIDIVATYNAHETMSADFDRGRRNQPRAFTFKAVRGPREIPRHFFSREEAAARKERVESSIEEATNSGRAVRLQAGRSFSQRFLVDGAIDEQPQVRFPKSTEVKSALKNGQQVIAEVDMRVPNGRHADIDDQGYRRPQAGPAGSSQRGGLVSGTVGLNYNAESDTVELDNSTTHLKCTCATYRSDYYCPHINYASRHFPNVGRQALPQVSRHPLLTVSLSKRPEIDVKKSADGTEYISINKERIYTNSRFYSDCFEGIPMPDDVADLSESQQAREVLSRDPGLAAITSVTAIEDNKIFHAALKRANTALPVAIRYECHGGTVRVDGFVIYQKTSDPSNLIPVSRQLQCTCADYQDSYDCRHVRDAENRGNLVAPTPLAEGVQSVGDIALSRVFDEDTRIFTRIFDDPSMSLEQAEEEEAEARRTAEEEEEARRLERIEAERQRQIRFMEEFPEHLERERRGWSEEDRQRVDQARADYEVYRESMMNRWSERDPGYSNDPQRFYEDYQKAASKRKFDYSYGGVLDGSSEGAGARRFGVEMEFVMPPSFSSEQRNKALRSIASDLHTEGLTASSAQQGYHSGANSNWAKWSFEHDSTVDGEIVSPLLKDDEESWKQLEKVCEIVKRHGGTVNNKVGSHVHVSTGSYGHSTAKHGELHRTVTQNEDVMYRLAANPKTRTHRGTQWCRPNIVDSHDDFPAEHLGGHRLFEAAHGHMLNMEPSSQMQQDRSHVEFRMWDGSLEPGVIQRQVMASVALTDAAERSVVANGGSKKPSRAPKKRGEHKVDEERVLAEAGVASHTPETLMKVNEQAASLFDQLFRRSEDRKKVLQLFARNSWQD